MTSYRTQRIAWSDEVGGNRREKEMEELRETVDEQRRAVSKVSDRFSRMQAKPGYFPLSEGGCGLLGQRQV